MGVLSITEKITRPVKCTITTHGWNSGQTTQYDESESHVSLQPSVHLSLVEYPSQNGRLGINGTVLRQICRIRWQHDRKRAMPNIIFIYGISLWERATFSETKNEMFWFPARDFNPVPVCRAQQATTERRVLYWFNRTNSPLPITPIRLIPIYTKHSQNSSMMQW